MTTGPTATGSRHTRRGFRRGSTAWQNPLEAFSTVLVALASILIIIWVIGEWRRLPRPKSIRVPSDPVSIVGAPSVGDSNAKRVIIEFSDFQCPYCGSFARESMPKLMADFVLSGKALLVFRQHPLTRIHPFAFQAAEAAVCAGRQQHFWQMHDSLFADQIHLDDASLIRRATELGLNDQAFRSCLNGEAAAHVRSDSIAAENLHLPGTPTFLIGSLRPDGDVAVSDVVSGTDYRAIVRALNNSHWSIRYSVWLGAILALGMIAGVLVWYRGVTAGNAAAVVEPTSS